MSTSESNSSDNNHIHDYDYGSRIYSSMISDEECESTETECYGDSVTEVSLSDDDTEFHEKISFISVFDTKNQKDTFFICYYKEILEYRKKLKKLNQKNDKAGNTLWGDVKAHIPWLGYVPLKFYDKSLVDGKPVNSINNSQNEYLVKNNGILKESVSRNKSRKKNKKSSEKQLADIINNSSNFGDKKCNSSNIKNNKTVENNKEKLCLITETEDKLIEPYINHNQSEKSCKTPVIASTDKEKTEAKQSTGNLSEIKKTPQKNKTNSKENSVKSDNKKETEDLEYIQSNEKVGETIIVSVKSTVTNNTDNKLTENESVINKSVLTSTTENKYISSDILEDSITKINQITKLAEISKKKKKKLKKKNRIQEQTKSPLNITSVTLTPIEQKKLKEKKNINNHKNLNQDTEQNMSDSMSNADDEDIDHVFYNDNIPTFYVERFKRNKKFQNRSKEKAPVSSSKKTDSLGSSDSEHENLFIKSKKRNKNVTVPKANLEESENFGEEAIEMIMKNNLHKAINCLTKAIVLNVFDYRHYLNRSYCYLRVEKPSFALADAQTVIQNSKNLGFLFIANLRAGQATNILKKYQQAEAFLREALGIYPDSPHSQRELLRVQIARIKEHEHPEKNAVIALENCPNTMDAIKYLNDTYIPKGDDDDNNEIFVFNNEYDDQIYESDDENSIARALNKLMNCHPEETKLLHVAQPLLTWLRPSTGLEKLRTSPARSSKTSSSGRSEKVTENAIWIGSLPDQISESTIKKTFRQYGNILSIHIVKGRNYGFINFERCEDAAKLLNSITVVKINGVEIIIRSAVRKE